MLLKVLFLVVVALAVGLPVTAVGQRKLLAEVDRFIDKSCIAFGSNKDETTSTYTSLSFHVYQNSVGEYNGSLSIYVQDDNTLEYYSTFCSMTSPGPYQGIFKTQFGNCRTVGGNPPPSPLNGCTQLLARLKGQTNQQDRCNIRDFYSYDDKITGGTVFIRSSETTTNLQASGTVEGIDCAFAVPVIGDISDGVLVQSMRTKKD
jgi:hypothetical protein